MRHMQSLGALAHFDYNLPGAYSYEQAFLAIRQLGLPMAAMEGAAVPLHAVQGGGA